MCGKMKTKKKEMKEYNTQVVIHRCSHGSSQNNFPLGKKTYSITLLNWEDYTMVMEWCQNCPNLNSVGTEILYPNTGTRNIYNYMYSNLKSVSRRSV